MNARGTSLVEVQGPCSTIPGIAGGRPVTWRALDEMGARELERTFGTLAEFDQLQMLQRCTMEGLTTNQVERARTLSPTGKLLD